MSEQFSKPEKSSQELQYELSRTGWNLENERREAEIFELKTPFEKILESLRNDIEGAHIGVLVGDDASGRVPTLLLKSVLSKIYNEKRIDSPQTLFVAGPGGGKEHDEDESKTREDFLFDYFGKKIDLKSFSSDGTHKVLIVTDSIKSGGSVLPLVKTFKKMGITCEVVSVGFVTDLEKERKIEELSSELGVKIHVGMEGTPRIYRKHVFGGVTKPTFDLFSEKLDDEEKFFADRYVDTVSRDQKVRLQRWINEIRREINVLSDELVGWYKEPRGQ